LSNTKTSNGTEINDQHGVDNVTMNRKYEIAHHTRIANKMLHDDFEREYIHVVDEHEEDMDGGILDHDIELDHLMQAT
jgi:hypothetical protein